MLVTVCLTPRQAQGVGPQASRMMAAPGVAPDKPLPPDRRGQTGVQGRVPKWPEASAVCKWTRQWFVAAEAGVPQRPQLRTPVPESTNPRPPDPLRADRQRMAVAPCRPV